MLMLKPLGKYILNRIRFLQVASCLLFGKDSSSSRTDSVVQTVMTDGHGALIDGNRNGC